MLTNEQIMQNKMRNTELITIPGSAFFYGTLEQKQILEYLLKQI